jgi:hypothetical protein
VTGRTWKGLAVGVAALALVGGAGAALAGGGLGFGNDRQALLNDAAKRLDVTPEKLQEALTGAYGDRLDAAVAAGTITQAQADELKQRAKDSGGVPFFGGDGHGGFGPHRGHGGGMSLDAAATYLGLSQTELRTELESGKTLAEIATAGGKTAAGLKQALSDAAKSKLDAAVKAGTLTQAQADELQTRLDAQLDDLIAGKAGPAPGPGFGHGFGRHRFGPPPAGGMPGPGDTPPTPSSFVTPI